MPKSVLENITKQAETLTVSESLELLERLVHQLRDKNRRTRLAGVIWSWKGGMA